MLIIKLKLFICNLRRRWKYHFIFWIKCESNWVCFSYGFDMLSVFYVSLWKPKLGTNFFRNLREPSGDFSGCIVQAVEGNTLSVQCLSELGSHNNQISYRDGLLVSISFLGVLVFFCLSGFNFKKLIFQTDFEAVQYILEVL